MYKKETKENIVLHNDKKINKYSTTTTAKEADNNNYRNIKYTGHHPLTLSIWNIQEQLTQNHTYIFNRRTCFITYIYQIKTSRSI